MNFKHFSLIITFLFIVNCTTGNLSTGKKDIVLVSSCVLCKSMEACGAKCKIYTKNEKKGV